MRLADIAVFCRKMEIQTFYRGDNANLRGLLSRIVNKRLRTIKWVDHRHE
jgi:hypothetical protein